LHNSFARLVEKVVLPPRAAQLESSAHILDSANEHTTLATPMPTATTPHRPVTAPSNEYRPPASPRLPGPPAAISRSAVLSDSTTLVGDAIGGART